MIFMLTGSWKRISEAQELTLYFPMQLDSLLEDFIRATVF